MLVATRPMSLSQLEGVFEHEENPPAREAIVETLNNLQSEYETRGIELVQVASGWRMQTRESMSPWIANLFQEKAPRYSRALLETLVLIAYRQPITRGEIEDARGVAVGSNIVRTLIERYWVKIVGHRDVPGRPSLLGTTKHFLDYFNLQKISELPTLSEIKALDEIAPELAQEVAMLDSTLAPEDEVAEIDAEAVDAESAEMAETESGSADEVSESAADHEEDSEDELEGDVVVSGSETVDVELSPEEDEIESEVQLEEPAASAESEEQLADSADEPANESANEPVTDSEQESVEEDEVASVAEATIDAISAVQRPETELLH